jgi:hypothetical protein
MEQEWEAESLRPCGRGVNRVHGPLVGVYTVPGIKGPLCHKEHNLSTSGGRPTGTGPGKKTGRSSGI